MVVVEVSMVGVVVPVVVHLMVVLVFVMVG
jgi:hypothetical protein